QGCPRSRTARRGRVTTSRGWLPTTTRSRPRFAPVTRGDLVTHADLVIVAGQPRVITDPRMLYVRAAAHGAVVAWTGQMADGSPILVCDSQGRSWRGPTSAFGMQCAGIVPRPDGGWQVTWVLGPTRWARVDLGADLRPIAPVTERDIPRTAGGAQGFFDVSLDQEPLWTDTHRMVTLDGHRL